MKANDQDLLQALIQNGLVPSFAFPLDTCTFSARESEDGATMMGANTSQDLRVALNSFVPGSYLTIDKKTYLSHGMTVTIPPFRPDSVVNRVRHIFENHEQIPLHRFCSNCNTVYEKMDDMPLGESKPCPICSVSASEGVVEVRRLIKPDGFAPEIVRVDREGQEVRQPAINGHFRMKSLDQTRQTSLGARFRAKAKFPSPFVDEDTIAGAIPELGKLIWDDEGWSNLKAYSLQKDGVEGEGVELVVANRGYDENGWVMCRDCGRVPLNMKELSTNEAHHRPYAISSEELRLIPEEDRESIELQAKKKCSGDWIRDLFFGFSFRTDLVYFRIKIAEPLELKERLGPAMVGGITAIKEAIITEATHVLKLVDREIEGGFRHITFPSKEEGRAGANTNDQFIDIYLFDSVSGGAGLVEELAEPGIIDEILVRVRGRLAGEKCQRGRPCQRACIGCLLDFRNSVEHDKLNRRHGLELLEYIRHGTPPSPAIHGGRPVARIIQRLDELSNDFLKFSVVQGHEVSKANYDHDMMKVLHIPSEKSKIAHMHSILTNWPTEGVIDLQDGFPINDVSAESTDEKICLIPYELARDSPGALITQLLRYFEQEPASSIEEDFTGYF